MNSYRHAQAAAKRWGGMPEDYLPIEEFLDSSKQAMGDVRHRALYHHTLGVYLCERIFGKVLTVRKSTDKIVQVPVREIAEHHIVEDLGFIPTPEWYLKEIPLHNTWMSGSRKVRHIAKEEFFTSKNKKENTE